MAYMRLIQFLSREGERRVAAILDDGAPRRVRDTATVRQLALEAHRAGHGLHAEVERRGLGEAIDYDVLIAEQRLLLPLDHEDPSRCLMAITGLTHLGSATQRDAMHAKLAAGNLTDSMRMFQLGLEDGRPGAGEIGVQPEWGYKGDGRWAVAPGQPLELPGHAEDGGEEAEIVGLYVIGDGGEVLRVGFALGNDYSDHVIESQNYLYLAHSKLRQASYGPELLVGELPTHVSGEIRIWRDGAVAWAGELLSGEANMCHSFANLEHHHFKYANFRRPGDVHVYFCGASALSCAVGFKCQPGDIYEISAPGFGRPLRNPLIAGAPERKVSVIPL